MRGSASAPVEAARRSAYTPAQTTTRDASTSPAVVSIDVTPSRRVNDAHLPVEEELAARVRHVPPVRLGDQGEVDDGGLRRVHCADAGDVGLDLAQSLRPDQLDARNAVRDRATMELLAGEGSSSSLVATTTLPQRRIGIPRSSQYTRSRAAPSTQSFALSDPGT